MLFVPSSQCPPGVFTAPLVCLCKTPWQQRDVNSLGDFASGLMLCHQTSVHSVDVKLEPLLILHPGETCQGAETQWEVYKANEKLLSMNRNITVWKFHDLLLSKKQNFRGGKDSKITPLHFDRVLPHVQNKGTFWCKPYTKGCSITEVLYFVWFNFGHPELSEINLWEAVSNKLASNDTLNMVFFGAKRRLVRCACVTKWSPMK